MGSEDGDNGIAPTSVFSSVALSVMYCTHLTITTISLTLLITDELM